MASLLSGLRTFFGGATDAIERLPSEVTDLNNAYTNYENGTGSARTVVDDFLRVGGDFATGAGGVVAAASVGAVVVGAVVVAAPELAATIGIAAASSVPLDTAIGTSLLINDGINLAGLGFSVAQVGKTAQLVGSVAKDLDSPEVVNNGKSVLSDLSKIGGDLSSEIVGYVESGSVKSIDLTNLQNAASTFSSDFSKFETSVGNAASTALNPPPPTPVVTGFIGDQVTLSHYYPSVDAADLREQGTATISSGTSLDLATLPTINPNPAGITTAPRIYSFTNSAVAVTYGGTFGPSLPNSVDEITTASSDPALTTVTLDPSSNVPGFSQSDITSSAHVIDLDFTGITATAGEKIVLDATFASSSSPASTTAATDPIITQSGTTLSGDSSESYNVTGSDLSDNIGINNTSPIFISGNDDGLTLPGAASDFSITDSGQGTAIELTGFVPSAGATITINDFQLDPTGSIILPSQYATPSAAVAALRSDGQGGSILPLGSGASLHFVGDSGLTSASFAVSHALS